HIIVLFPALLMWRCAQVAPLTGGQRDSQAPKLLNAIPQNISLNFKAKFIELTFDEYIQVKDIANQLVITPQLKNQPEVEAKGKKVIINLSYTELLPNTTYRFFF
ncbi:MAG TPA: Ig-like domain-containing protein, partial [Bacteroidia bacterium]|nr:Ig-like domain-containing protein [Bacteroidia bacterium]